MPDDVREVQCDGLVGPTHHFAGLSHGNLASLAHAGRPSRPRAAVRQGLAKMRLVAGLGVVQALLPPLERPDLAVLRGCGFHGSDRQVLAAAAAEEPFLLAIAASSAAMWTANAATVAPSSDTVDRRCRVLTANLIATPHRALEAAARAAQLRRAFPRPDLVEVLDPLPASPALADEGAANHVRLCAGPGHGAPGVHLFVHGRAAGLAAADLPQRFPARQAREGSAAVARRLGLDARRVVHARQLPAAIDAGAFHNDVVMVGDRDRLLLHAQSLVDQPAVLARLAELVPGLRCFAVAAADLPLDQAVASYLFNSQLLSTPAGLVLVAPAQAAEGAAERQVRRMLDEGFIVRAEFVQLDQSMANGGGPACLRLRLALGAGERAGLAPGLMVDDGLLDRLEAWADRHYREELRAADLADPQLLDEGRAALDELTGICGLGSCYPFQQTTQRAAP